MNFSAYGFTTSPCLRLFALWVLMYFDQYSRRLRIYCLPEIHTRACPVDRKPRNQFIKSHKL